MDGPHATARDAARRAIAAAEHFHSERYFSCEEIDEASVANVASAVSFLQCGRGGFFSEVQRVEFPRFFIDKRYLSNETLLQAAPQPGWVWFTTPLAAGSAYVWNGVPLDRPAVVVNGRSNTWFRRSRDVTGLTIGIESDLVESALAARTPAREIETITASNHVFTDGVDAVVRLARQLAAALDRRSSAVCAATAEAPLQRLLLDRFVGLLGRDGADAAYERRLERARLLVRDAERIIDSGLAHRLGSGELATALDVSIRTLQTAFAGIYGLGPNQYVKLRRLHAVRQTLRRADSRRAPVKRAALAAGFTELGRFAGEYRALFGESPSETADRAAGTGMPPAASPWRLGR